MKENVLQHYGVLGMKWGIRKDPRESLRTSEWSRTLAQHRMDQIMSNTQNINQISNAELQQLINRLQMERQLSQLSKDDTKKGENIVMQAGKTVVKAQLIKYGNQALSAAIDSLIKKYKGGSGTP